MVDSSGLPLSAIGKEQKQMNGVELSRKKSHSRFPPSKDKRSDLDLDLEHLP